MEFDADGGADVFAAVVVFVVIGVRVSSKETPLEIRRIEFDDVVPSELNV